MVDNDLFLSICVVIIAIIMKRRRRRSRKRKVWSRDWIKNRQRHGAYHHLLQELRVSDSSSYYNFLRMDVSTFEELLSVTAPAISYPDTNMREAITPGERLAVTLRFLATGMYVEYCIPTHSIHIIFCNRFTIGETYASLQYIYRIPAQTIGKIVPETCSAIIQALREYLQVKSHIKSCMSLHNQQNS